MTLRVQKYILRFEVTIDDSVLVEMGESKNNLSRIKPSPILREPDLVAQVEEQFSTIQKICHEIQALVRLKRVVELDHEGVRDLLHDVALDLHLVRLVCANDKVFLEGLDGVNLRTCLFLSQVDFAK